MEIAKKQRYLHLLQKIKENKTLSRTELVELERYERQAAGKITSKARITSRIRLKKSSGLPTKKKRKTAATSKRVKKTAGSPQDALRRKKIKKKGRPARRSMKRRSAGWDSNAKI